jgi:hypothetical protein
MSKKLPSTRPPTAAKHLQVSDSGKLQAASRCGPTTGLFVIAMTHGEWTDPEVGDWEGGRDMRRSGPSDRTGPESSRRGRLEPVALGDASSERAARGVSVVSRDDASPAAVHDLLTDAQLAARWQLSRGTLANQRSQGRGPAYLKLAGRIRYRLSDIEAYEQAGFVSREPAGTTSPGDPSDVRETVARLIRSLGS